MTVLIVDVPLKRENTLNDSSKISRPLIPSNHACTLSPNFPSKQAIAPLARSEKCAEISPNNRLCSEGIYEPSSAMRPFSKIKAMIRLFDFALMSWVSWFLMERSPISWKLKSLNSLLNVRLSKSAYAKDLSCTMMKQDGASVNLKNSETMPGRWPIPDSEVKSHFLWDDHEEKATQKNCDEQIPTSISPSRMIMAPIETSSLVISSVGLTHSENFEIWRNTHHSRVIRVNGAKRRTKTSNYSTPNFVRS